ncbi:MAG: bifunctional 5,10-methylene-tetrahydrofolate dehydrogenase/5,10-methylene-tetrahydrofolate cyclohydrolase [Firmicutes bacterium]|nr:bifunctional 5,10-methylene-tetrahydrofolate dehydrogenase/5,10-methylene-tetrahydrofolate cyclohydrolase [Bacillota bacterium]
MSAKFVYGKEVATTIRSQIVSELATLKELTGGDVPGLGVVLVGEDPASRAYVVGKQKRGKVFGYHSVVRHVPADTKQKDVLHLIEELNEDDSIHGILVQLPLPDQIDEKAVIDAINHKKDVDGFHPRNVGNLVSGKDSFIPCTPNACMKILEHIHYDLKGKHVVVVGRSNIVGKPISLLMLRQHATVTVCHSNTPDLAAVCREGDVVVVAVGEPGLITGDMIKKNAVVIDVGVTRVGEKLVGDVDVESVKEVASYITPVPGGVGPMTITMLMLNTLQAFKRKHGLK